MKPVFAILSSLLLIAAHTLTVAAPVSCGLAVAKSACCDGCVQCACCMTESEDAPASAPQSTAPVRDGCQFVFVPSAQILFEVPSACADKAFSFSDASLTAVQPPILQRNCVLLI